MAYTVTKTDTVFGNQKVAILKITADAATQNVETGLAVINGFAMGVQSLSTMGIKIYANSSATGVATPGTLGMSGLVSGDSFFITCYGR